MLNIFPNIPEALLALPKTDFPSRTFKTASMTVLSSNEQHYQN